MMIVKSIKKSVPHVCLWLYIALMFIPIYLAIVAASHNGEALLHAPFPLLPGKALIHNLKSILMGEVIATGGEPLIHLLRNSTAMALLIALGKVFLALFSAFALVYFQFPFKRGVFVLIFSTLMLPVEVRIVPTFQVVASFGWVNSFSGLTLPLMASATATFLFRQFFKTIPNEIVDAARLDGAGPIRFFFNILLPLSMPQIAALFIILFVYGWNQYLWPLVMTTKPSMATIVMGIRYLSAVVEQIPQWHYVMAIALIALLVPCVLVVFFQQWFEKGLVE